MPSSRQKFGTQAEDRAAQFLQSKGFTILDRHVTSRYGEIDLLAEDQDTVVAVEVKARRSTAFGRAIEAITPTKYEKIAAALHDTLEQRGWQNRPYRIDAVTIDGAVIEHHPSIG